MKISDKFWQVTATIEENDGMFLYSVVQDFDDESDDFEVLAKGDAMSFEHAKRLILDELKGL